MTEVTPITRTLTEDEFAKVATFENILAWQLKTFGNITHARIAVRFLEEAVELCLKSGALPQDIQIAVDDELRKANTLTALPYDREGVLMEMADLMIILVGVANNNGYSEDDVEAGVQVKHDINLARKWNIRGDGTGYHREPVPGDDPGDSNDG